MEYFIIYSTEDIELGVSEPLTKEEVEFRLAQRFYGDLPIYHDTSFLREGKIGYGKGMVIIKGEAVRPKKVEVVTKFEV
jgi:hypothetical protein